MNKEKALRNVRLYAIFWMLKEPLFWGPVLIIFIQMASKMSLSEVYLMESACIVTAILLQVPTGALADLIGRKKTMMIGSGLLILMMLMFSCATTKWEMWLANIVAFAGYTFLSGADSALLYDSLRFLGRESEHRNLLGKMSGYRFVLVAVCALVCGWVSEINIRWPLYLCLPPLAINFLLLFFLTEPPYAGNKKYNSSGHFSLMKASVLFVANHKKVKWAIGFIVLVSVAGKLWFFSYNPYFQLVGLSLTKFGYIFCALNLVAAVSSYSTQKIHDRLGDVGSIIVILACLFVPILIMGTAVAPWAAWLVITQNFVRGYFDPFMTDFLNQYLDSENRATVLSVKSAVSELAQLIALLAFGGLLAVWSLPVCLQILGMTVLIGGAWLVFTYFRLFKEAKSVS
ncbi:MAG: MFS transporter [bacterium]